MHALENASRNFAARYAPILAAWSRTSGALDAHRIELGVLADNLDGHLKHLEAADLFHGEVYDQLYRGLSHLMLALQTKPISLAHCLKAIRSLRAAAIAKPGVAAGVTAGKGGVA